MEVRLCYLRSPYDMKIKNTQLAAALIALGEKLLPSTDFNAPDVVFDFDDKPELERYEILWKEMWSGLPPSDDALSMMFKLSKARKWILEQAVHGDHNSGLTLPATTFEVTELHLAIWLVANDHYLLKLDKSRRVFHFAAEAKEIVSEITDYDKSYLRELDYLIRRIGCRDLARQKVMQVV